MEPKKGITTDSTVTCRHTMREGVGQATADSRARACCGIWTLQPCKPFSLAAMLPREPPSFDFRCDGGAPPAMPACSRPPCRLPAVQHALTTMTYRVRTARRTHRGRK